MHFGRDLRYIMTNKIIQLSCRPPTSASAHQHLYRVYYQVYVWLDNQLNSGDCKLTGQYFGIDSNFTSPAMDNMLLFWMYPDDNNFVVKTSIEWDI